MIVDDKIVTTVIDKATCTGNITMSTMVSKTQLATACFAVDMIDEAATTRYESRNCAFL